MNTVEPSALGSDVLMVHCVSCCVRRHTRHSPRHSMLVHSDSTYISNAITSHMQIDKAKMTDQYKLERVRNEVEIHRQLNHPSILEVRLRVLAFAFFFTCLCLCLYYFSIQTFSTSYNSIII